LTKYANKKVVIKFLKIVVKIKLFLQKFLNKQISRVNKFVTYDKWGEPEILECRKIKSKLSKNNCGEN